MSRPAALLLSLVLLNGLLFAIGAGRGEGAECRAEVCVGLVFDVGGIGDKSFNDAAYRGLRRARDELGIAFRYIEPGDGSDRESALRQLASADYDLVIGVGFIFSDDLRKLAPEFPSVQFAGIDFSPGKGPPPPNLAGLRFREHEGSFLVGAIAGLVSESGAVGFVGGMDIPLIHKFEAGYAAGVEHVCPECRVFSAYAGTTPEAFSDPVTGRELAMTQYGRGADIIFHASGKTGSGVFRAARDLGKWAIGVDSDQFHEAPCCVLTSMVKKVELAVFEIIEDAARGRFSGGVRELGLAQEGVEFVYDENNQGRIPEEVVAKVREIGSRIVAGEIEVPHE